MTYPRTSGILLHPTSLPGRYGIGDLGHEAFAWIDWLAAARQSIWQILPLGPTGFADSPYACLSAFAGNPLLISPDRLIESGDLSTADMQDLPMFSDERVDYGAVIAWKMPLLRRAAQRFLTQATGERQERFRRFCAENAAWLDDFCLFITIKEHFNQRMWTEWEANIALRETQALARWRQSKEIALHQVLQFFFWEQWQALKSYANAHGVRIVGDVPIFVAEDSADVWANRDLFHLDETGRPVVIAGVPPDYFSETGQRWGNPLYRWDVMAERGYRWWIERIKNMLDQVDIVRIDHFRGFVAYWEIPAGEPTAVKGRWVAGPGAALFEAIEKELGRLPIWAEDLGVITPEVIGLRERFGFPGMKILQFAFDEDALRASFGNYTHNPFLPHNYTQNFVVYTGTHDNDTALGWFNNSSAEARQKALEYLGCDAHTFNWSLIRAAMASVAHTAILPLQDLLGLGTEARMNLPGTTGNNWTWRCPPEALTEQLAERLAKMTRCYERISRQEKP